MRRTIHLMDRYTLPALAALSGAIVAALIAIVFPTPAVLILPILGFCFGCLFVAS